MSKNYEHPAGKGTLFINKYKEKESQPDYKGSGKTLDGKEIEIAGWKGQTQSGDAKLSIQFSEPYVKEENANSNTPPSSSEGQEEIGF